MSTSTSLRIGLAPPLWTPIPPRTYGGIELIVHLLGEELVRRGHDVTLFGTGDSQTSGRLVPVCERNMLDYMAQTEAYVYEAYANAAVAHTLAHAGECDILHFHTGMHWLPFASLVPTPSLFTIHTFASHDDRYIADQFPGVALSGISHYQAAQVAGASGRPVPVVYNGCDLDSFTPSYQSGQYLAFLGRMSFDKNPLGAIQIARAVNMPLILAGQAQQAKEEAYFEKEIVPHIDGKMVRYIGPVNHQQKNDLLKNAAALIFPVQWEEPFGLVMIEAMACGTPVLARTLGSVGEVVDPGITGYHAAEIEEMTQLLPATLALDRRRVRQQVDSRFSCTQMVDGYENLYRSLIANKP